MTAYFLSPESFARRNGVSRMTVYRLLKRGELAARKLGRKTVISIDAEREWRRSLPTWQPAGERREGQTRA